MVLKSSPEAPGEGYLIAEVAEAVGLPPGVLNVVTADREVSELLVRDPRVDKITFIGSTAAGRRIGSIGGERIARCTLELGGKSAAVIPAADRQAGPVLAIGGAVADPASYSMSQLRALPAETVTVPGPGGAGGVQVTGVSLDHLVTIASPALPAVKNALLRVIVTASGPAGRKVSFALGALSPTATSRAAATYPGSTTW